MKLSETKRKTNKRHQEQRKNNQWNSNNHWKPKGFAVRPLTESPPKQDWTQRQYSQQLRTSIRVSCVGI